MKSTKILLLLLVLGLSFLVVVNKPKKVDALSSQFGVVAPVPSLGSDSAKKTAIDRAADGGFGWIRYEFEYNNPVSFEHYDATHAKAKARGLSELGLLIYPGGDKTIDDWKNYVQEVVSHYGNEIAGWEIMNEADNYLSPAQYVTYLKEAHSIIRGINPGAIIVSSGVTARAQASTFIQGISSNGGWGYIDKVGLHVYHSGNPEKVNFGGGDIVSEIQIAVSAINSAGGGKGLWITETGYQSSAVSGDTNQADYLARSIVMAKSISSLEKIFIYRLFDADGGYGLLNNSFDARTSYERVKEVISNISGLGTGERIYPQDKNTVENFDSSDNWTTIASSNASVNLGGVSGKIGNAMSISYNFSQDSAYALVEKNKVIDGSPSALAIWINGDNTKNIWKLRYKDTFGETFQADLGSIPNGWNYKQVNIKTDQAIVSWDGNGNVDYPISFQGFVIDRQGGSSSGSGIVDDVIAISSGEDLFAYLFGLKVAFWKVSGASSTVLCKSTRDFIQSPRYASPVDCSDTPTTQPAPSSNSNSSEPAQTTTNESVTPAPTKAPVKQIKISAEKSEVRLDGENAISDGKSFYTIVITLRDEDGNIVKNVTPELIAKTFNTDIEVPILIGNEWLAKLTAKVDGEKEIEIKALGVSIKTIKMLFSKPAVAKDVLKSEKIVKEPEVAETKWQKLLSFFKNNLNYVILGAVGSALFIYYTVMALKQKKLFPIIFKRKKEKQDGNLHPKR